MKLSGSREIAARRERLKSNEEKSSTLVALHDDSCMVIMFCTPACSEGDFDNYG